MNAKPFTAFLAAGALAATSAAQFGRPSVEQQIRLGRDAAAEIRRKERVLPANDARVRLVRRIGARLVRTLPANDPWQYSFDVVDDKEMNAFALPGGPTFINTGLLDRCRTEDEIAGIFGHEITHVRQQHWASRVKVQQERGLLGLLAGAVFRVNPNVLQGLDLLSSLNTLQFSRRDETKSDDGGMQMMIDAGYNPIGMVKVFEILQAGAGGRGGGPDWLRTHPDPGKRSQRLRDMIASKRRSFPPETPIDGSLSRDEFQDRRRDSSLNPGWSGRRRGG